ARFVEAHVVPPDVAAERVLAADRRRARARPGRQRAADRTHVVVAGVARAVEPAGGAVGASRGRGDRVARLARGDDAVPAVGHEARGAADALEAGATARRRGAPVADLQAGHAAVAAHGVVAVDRGLGGEERRLKRRAHAVAARVEALGRIRALRAAGR